jgi:hypothetical protein
VYVAPHHSEQVNLNERATANDLTLRVTSATNGTDTDARREWETYDTDTYAPLNPVPGSKYVILNVSAADANGSSAPFRYADSILVGNDERSYYPNYAVGNASCTASITADQLKADSTCDVYIAFSIPDNVAPVKIVYTASNPAIVVNLV